MENWRDVVGYEGIYQVSDLGRVKSLDRDSYFIRRGKKIPRKHISRILKQHQNMFGYMTVCLNKPGSKQRSHKVHRIVAEAFIDNQLSYLQVNHIDGKKDNNKIENLEWCNNKQNIVHAYSIGLIMPKLGSNSHLAKIKEEDVIKIKKLILSGETLENIARLYNISASMVGRIKANKAWKHVILHGDE